MKGFKEYIENVRKYNFKKYFSDTFFLKDKFDLNTDEGKFLARYLPHDDKYEVHSLNIMKGNTIDSYERLSKVLSVDKKELGKYEDSNIKMVAYDFDGINGVFVTFKKNDSDIKYSLILANRVGEIIGYNKLK